VIRLRIAKVRAFITVKTIASTLIAFLFALSETVAGSAHAQRLARFEFSQTHMGTRFTIILYARDARIATRASAAAFKRIEGLDATMSDYRPTSELMTVCSKSGGGWIKVSDDLFRILELSQEAARRTDGAFDVTVGPIVRLWRRSRRIAEMPEAQSLARALELTGYDKLKLDEKTRSVRLDKPGMLLDLGGIAKGYAADEAIAVLKKEGIRRALIAAGGDIVVSGPPPGKREWLIGIAPLEPSDEPPTAYVKLCDAAVSTSGEREQYVEIGGVRYSHITDPRTGLAVTGHSSVTVVAPTGTVSDSIATAASVLGPKRGLEIIDSIEGASALFIQATAQGVRTFQSARWKSVKPRRASRRI
jgi:FAD:protein FMN transferase